jgi:hypothetical protein
MIEIIHWTVMKSTKVIVQKVKYIVVNCDEVPLSIINFGEMCMYTLFPGFRKVPLLLNLEKVFSGNIINNLTQLILRSLMEHGA